MDDFSRLDVEVPNYIKFDKFTEMLTDYIHRCGYFGMVEFNGIADHTVDVYYLAGSIDQDPNTWKISTTDVGPCFYRVSVPFSIVSTVSGYDLRHVSSAPIIFPVIYQDAIRKMLIIEDVTDKIGGWSEKF